KVRPRYRSVLRSCALTDTELFAERIREVRESVGLKQVQVAKEFDIDPKHMNRFERGQVNPSFGIIFQLARLYKVSPATFFEFEKNQKDSKVLKERMREIVETRDFKQLQQAYRVLKALFEP